MGWENLANSHLIFEENQKKRNQIPPNLGTPNHNQNFLLNRTCFLLNKPSGCAPFSLVTSRCIVPVFVLRCSSHGVYGLVSWIPSVSSLGSTHHCTAEPRGRKHPEHWLQTRHTGVLQHMLLARLSSSAVSMCQREALHALLCALVNF